MITQKDRMYELDALQGLAALSVILYHYSTRYGQLFSHVKTPYFINFNLGHFGVQLFFVISGFVIYMTLIKCQSAKEFALKRMIRLYPAYIISVALTFALVTLYHLEGREVSLKVAILNLTMLQEFIPGTGHVDGAYWSLTIEIVFYFIIGFIFLFRSLKKIELISLVWLIVASIINILDASGILSLM